MDCALDVFTLRSAHVIVVHVLTMMLSTVSKSSPTSLGYISECIYSNCYTMPDDFNSVLLPWDTAEAWCNKHSSTLAVIRSQDIQDDVQDFLARNAPPSSAGRNFFINAKANGSVTAAGNESTFYTLTGAISDLVIIQQNSTTLDYSYVYLQTAPPLSSDQSPSFVAGFPLWPLGYICQYSRTSPECSTSRSYHLMYSSSCYVAYPDDSSWYSARSSCLNLGGDLALIDSQMYFSASWNWLNASSRYFIGVRSSWWTWQDSLKSDVLYSNFGSVGYNAFVNQRICLQTNPWRAWQTCDADSYNAFVCQNQTTSNVTRSTYRPSTTSLTTFYQSSSNYSLDPLNNLALILGVSIGGGVGFILLLSLVIISIIVCTRKCRRKIQETPANVYEAPNDITGNKVEGDIYTELDEVAHRSNTHYVPTPETSSARPVRSDNESCSDYVNYSEFFPPKGQVKKKKVSSRA